MFRNHGPVRLILPVALTFFISFPAQAQNTASYSQNILTDHENPPPMPDKSVSGQANEDTGQKQANTTPFLMTQTPLSRPTVVDAAAGIEPVAQNCSEKESNEEITKSCRNNYSDGSYETFEERRETRGDNPKRQTIIFKYGARDSFKFRQEVRQKTGYGYYDYERKKRAEFFDTVTTTEDGNVIREIMIFEYHLATGKIKKITWTKYDRIGDTYFAALKNHVMLTYDEKGNPVSGKAEKFLDNDRTDTLFEWNVRRDGMNRFQPDMWRQWENLMQQMVGRAAAP